VNPFNPRSRRQPSRGASSPVWRLISAACVASLASCASYEHVKGNVQLKLDQTNEGVESLRKATRHAPTDAEYKIDYLRKRDQSVQDLLAAAESLRDQGKLAESKTVFERVLEMDQGNARAAAGLAKLAQQARHAKLLADGESQLTNGKVDLALDRAQQVLAVDTQDFRAKKLKVAAMETLSSLELERSRASAARTLLEKPVTLQFNDAPLRTVFESLSKSVGLNVLLDRDVKNNARVSIFVKDIAVADAIDFILMQNQLERRLINSNTLLIYPSTDAKKAEYEDLTIRSFQITNADIKYLSNLLKTMLKLREVAADERSGVLVIRDTAEKLNLAAKLIAAHDVADPEIMLEVEVLEVSSTRNSNLGLLPPNSITFATPVPQGGLTWGALKALRGNDLLVTPLAATFNFKLEDIDAKLLASPRIRARNREKARIMIGDRVPTITNTVTPLTTGSSVVTGTVTYLDVGLRLEVESQVYADNEVGIKLALEVSNIVAEFTDPQGGRSYQIGTRNANTNLRLKDGETQILGGLITDQDRNTASKIPGLGHLPIVGRLFGNNNGNSINSEIVLSITPRIVRNLADRPPEIRSIFSGTLNGMREKPILAEPLRQLKFTPPAANAAGTATTPPQNAEVPTPGQTAGGTTPILFNSAPSTEQPAVPPGGGLLPAPPQMIPRPPASR
jgi:general secretion pathway protein D